MNRKDNRRSILGLVVRPREQLRMAATVTGWSVLLTITLLTCVGVSLTGTIQRWSEMSTVDPEVAFIFQHSLLPALGLLALTLIVVAVLVMFLIIKGSNRFYGPLVPIQRHIENLTNGDFGSRLALREGDELTELRDSLNKLAETLQAKRP